jgi:hypothetical protein
MCLHVAASRMSIHRAIDTSTPSTSRRVGRTFLWRAGGRATAGNANSNNWRQRKINVSLTVPIYSERAYFSFHSGTVPRRVPSALGFSFAASPLVGSMPSCRIEHDQNQHDEGNRTERRADGERKCIGGIHRGRGDGKKRGSRWRPPGQQPADDESK